MRTSVRGKRKMNYGLWNALVRTDPKQGGSRKSCSNADSEIFLSEKLAGKMAKIHFLFRVASVAKRKCDL